jgi:hypothetical protein
MATGHPGTIRVAGSGEGVMSLMQRYSTAVVEAFRGHPGEGGGLLPLALAEACLIVLPVEGAGLSVVSKKLRVPLSASDPAVARAERLQTTLGEGPCLAVTASKKSLIADLDTMSQRWPTYYSAVMEQTPFRSVASIPLDTPFQRLGALDLYSTDPSGAAFTNIATIERAVAAQAAAALVAAPTAVNSMGVAIPVWLDTDLVRNRLEVWIAVGIMVAYAGLNDDNSLAVLRAYAFSHDTTLDDLAQRLATTQLHPSVVMT